MGYVYKGKKHDLTDPWEDEPIDQPSRDNTQECQDVGLKPCGTPAAYARHKRHGETPCELCRKAQCEYVATRAGRGTTYGKRGTARCGTYAGAIAHSKRGEKRCPDCTKAAYEYQLNYRNNKAA